MLLLVSSVNRKEQCMASRPKIDLRKLSRGDARIETLLEELEAGRRERKPGVARSGWTQHFAAAGNKPVG